MNKTVKIVLLVVLGLFVVGVGVPFVLGALSSVNPNKAIEMAKEKSQETVEGSGEKTVTLADGYTLTFTVPEGYKYSSDRYGDYVARVKDNAGNTLIGFAIGGAGENTPMGKVTVDGVPFTIDYRKNIGCPIDMYSKSSTLFFDIVTWCADEKETQLPLYNQVISSIKFSNKFKDVLLGKASMPVSSAK